MKLYQAALAAGVAIIRGRNGRPTGPMAGQPVAAVLRQPSHAQIRDAWPCSPRCAASNSAYRRGAGNVETEGAPNVVRAVSDRSADGDQTRIVRGIPAMAESISQRRTGIAVCRSTPMFAGRQYQARQPRDAAENHGGSRSAVDVNSHVDLAAGRWMENIRRLFGSAVL